MRQGDHQRFGLRLRLGDHVIGFFQREGEGFFQQHMTAGPQRIQRDGMVQVMRHENRHGIDAAQTGAIIDQRLDIGGCQHGGDGLGARLIGVGGPEHLDPFAEPVEGLYVKGRDPAAADDAQFVFLHVARLYCDLPRAATAHSSMTRSPCVINMLSKRLTTGQM